MRNEQAPSPRIRGGTGTLEVHSIFYTIQGEGPHAGRPAVFVRLYGCNLQCPACDTDYTSTRTSLSPAALARIVAERYAAPGPPLVIITGGEPFRQPIGPAVEALLDLGCLVQVETNGTLPPPSLVDALNFQVVCSPKTGAVNKALLPFITAYKYVLAADSIALDDGLPLRALEHPARPRLARPRKGFNRRFIYVQPMDPDPEGANLRACIDATYRFGYTLSLQQHKIIGVP